MRRLISIVSVTGLLFLFFGCGDSKSGKEGKIRDLSEQLAKPKVEWGEIAYLPLDSTFSLKGEYLPEYDSAVSFDGNGSIRINAQDSILVNIATVDNFNLQESRLYYEAMLHTKDFKGKVYLEMRIDLGSGPNYYTRDQYNPLVDTKDWEQHQAYMIISRPQYVKQALLQLNICGKGTVWIDDIHLYKSPLKENDVSGK